MKYEDTRRNGDVSGADLQEAMLAKWRLVSGYKELMEDIEALRQVRIEDKKTGKVYTKEWQASNWKVAMQLHGYNGADAAVKFARNHGWDEKQSREHRLAVLLSTSRAFYMTAIK